MHIKYKQYTIEKAEKHHSNLLASWWNDGNIMSYFGYPLGMNVTEDDVISELDNDQQKLYHRLMICADNTYVGETYYQHLDNETAKIGIRICNHALQNKGMGRIILSMLISYLFDDLGYKFVTVTTNLTNERAQHVYEKLGFKKIHVDVNTEIDQLGIPQSFIVYLMDKDEFINFAE